MSTVSVWAPGWALHCYCDEELTPDDVSRAVSPVLLSLRAVDISPAAPVPEEDRRAGPAGIPRAVVSFHSYYLDCLPRRAFEALVVWKLRGKPVVLEAPSSCPEEQSLEVRLTLGFDHNVDGRIEVDAAELCECHYGGPVPEVLLDVIYDFVWDNFVPPWADAEDREEMVREVWCHSGAKVLHCLDFVRQLRRFWGE